MIWKAFVVLSEKTLINLGLYYSQALHFENEALKTEERDIHPS
jgi:hypothetical protein